MFTPSSDAKQLEFSEDRGPKISKADVQSVKYKRSSNSVVREPATNVSLATDYTVEKHSSEALLSDRSKRIGDGLKEDKVEHQVSTMPGNMTITKMDDAAVASLLELNDASRTDCLQEQVCFIFITFSSVSILWSSKLNTHHGLRSHYCYNIFPYSYLFAL